MTLGWWQCSECCEHPLPDEPCGGNIRYFGPTDENPNGGDWLQYWGTDPPGVRGTAYHGLPKFFADWRDEPFSPFISYRQGLNNYIVIDIWMDSGGNMFGHGVPRLKCNGEDIFYLSSNGAWSWKKKAVSNDYVIAESHIDKFNDEFWITGNAVEYEFGTPYFSTVSSDTFAINTSGAIVDSILHPGLGGTWVHHNGGSSTVYVVGDSTSLNTGDAQPMMAIIAGGNYSEWSARYWAQGAPGDLTPLWWEGSPGSAGIVRIYGSEVVLAAGTGFDTDPPAADHNRAVYFTAYNTSGEAQWAWEEDRPIGFGGPPRHVTALAHSLYDGRVVAGWFKPSGTGAQGEHYCSSAGISFMDASGGTNDLFISRTTAGNECENAGRHVYSVDHDGSLVFVSGAWLGITFHSIGVTLPIGSVIAYDPNEPPAGSKIVWAYDPGSGSGPMRYNGSDTVFAVVNTPHSSPKGPQFFGRVVALDSSDGSLQWSFDHGGRIYDVWPEGSAVWITGDRVQDDPIGFPDVFKTTRKISSGSESAHLDFGTSPSNLVRGTSSSLFVSGAPGLGSDFMSILRFDAGPNRVSGMNYGGRAPTDMVEGGADLYVTGPCESSQLAAFDLSSPDQHIRWGLTQRGLTINQVHRDSNVYIIGSYQPSLSGEGGVPWFGILCYDFARKLLWRKDGPIQFFAGPGTGDVYLSGGISGVSGSLHRVDRDTGVISVSTDAGGRLVYCGGDLFVSRNGLVEKRDGTTLDLDYTTKHHGHEFLHIDLDGSCNLVGAGYVGGYRDCRSTTTSVTCTFDTLTTSTSTTTTSHTCLIDGALFECQETAPDTYNWVGLEGCCDGWELCACGPVPGCGPPGGMPVGTRMTLDCAPSGQCDCTTTSTETTGTTTPTTTSTTTTTTTPEDCQGTCTWQWTGGGWVYVSDTCVSCSFTCEQNGHGLPPDGGGAPPGSLGFWPCCC